ncbi:hypothetical protein D9619_002399 [Psilocybe cf. subviscida]|uniref:NADP-dependent oxidoreductase domain-containing protein n=1 Tax=Psilocybe cf. subviscida TaxID=2480587 RepID=A0A8H5ETL5_9AGAR|nr:hypothetical protein D9619_002399 [Psilocybe cf. subviscida]
MPFTPVKLNDGNEVPSIAFGSGSVNKGNDIHLYIEQAIDVGFVHLDTAQFYRNQEIVGTAIRNSKLKRSKLFVTSKWGYGDPEYALRESLKQIDITYLDLYLIHSPNTIPNGDVESAWKTMERFREEGYAKSIGVSNFELQDLERLLKIAKVKPAVNQIKLHPYNHAQTAELLAYHAKHGIVTEAYGSLAPITAFPGGPVDAALKKAADRLGISPTQVIFLWVKAKGAVIVTTSSKRTRLEEYFAVGDLPALTAEEVFAIDTAGAKGAPSSKEFREDKEEGPLGTAMSVARSEPRYALGAIAVLLMISLYTFTHCAH